MGFPAHVNGASSSANPGQYVSAILPVILDTFRK